MSEDFSWEVFPAKNRQVGMGGVRPSATLRLQDGDQREYLYVPERVARVLQRKRKNDHVAVSDAAELRAFVDELSKRVAKDWIVDMLMRREYSSLEVRRKLRNDGFAKATVNDVVQDSCNTGLINDRRFADSFIRSKLCQGWGLSRIERELALRGVRTDELPNWPYDYADPESEIDRAIEVGSRRHVREPNAYPKMVRFLVGRGFSYGVSTEAARTLLA